MLRSLAQKKNVLPRLSVLAVRHNSAVPFTRKKHRNASNDTSPSSSSYSFEEQSQSMLKEIEKAISPMKELNKQFEFVRLAGEFQVNTGENGWFLFKINNKDKTICMSSPISGPFEYEYCPRGKVWQCVIDRHDMRGMIVRDMLRKFVGFPKF